MQISEVIGHIRTAEHITFIIGAGASRSAGIPTAPGLIELIEAKFSHCLTGLSASDRKHYGKVMGTLSPANRKMLIEPLLDEAKLNWGHIALANVVLAAKVRRVLSFNFDFLLERATSLMGAHLPVYDFGVAPSRHVTGLADKAIFHLHGQSYGLTLLNTDAETKAHAEKLRPLLADSLRNHLTIVIGYSGEADAAFDVMKDVFDSTNNLIWFGHDPEPKSHLKPLLDKDFAGYIGGCDFDLTMIKIAQGLGCWPIPIIDNPTQHVLTLLAPLPDFPVTEKEQTAVLTDTRARLEAVAGGWKKERTDTEQAAEELMSGQIEERPGADEGLSDAARELRAWTYISQGDKLKGEAIRLQGAERAAKFTEAHEKYQAALAIKPEILEALNRWGGALWEEAKLLDGEASARKFSEASEKYAMALAIEPHLHAPLHNWGVALHGEAGLLDGDARVRKLAEACEKYAAALAIKPDLHEALYNWGNALSDEAKRLGGEARAMKLAEAGEKYAAAIAIKPDYHEALSNWSTTLIHEVTMLEGQERVEKLKLAESILTQAKSIMNKPKYNLACIYALTGRTAEALEELEACLADDTLPSATHLEQDSDLASLRDEPRFAALMQRRG